MKRIFICLLAAIMLSSCSVGENENIAENSDNNQAAETVAQLSEEEKVLQNLTQVDYNGYSANYYQYLMPHVPDITKYLVTVDEMTGESVADAVYNVSSLVEERLNVELTTINYPNDKEMASVLNNSIATGEDICDAFFSHSAVSFLRNGMVMNLSEINSFDFDNPWWNHWAIESANITDEVYFAYGSLSTVQYAFYAPFFFNKTLADNANLPDLYQIVREGKWTLDKMDQLIESVTLDANGDGKMHIQDDILGVSFGVLTWGMYGSGGEIFTKDENGYLTYTGLNEKTIGIFEKMSAIVCDSYKYYSSWSVSGVAQYHAIMTDNLLFAQMHMMEAENLRDMESDYGILPTPKYTEEDEYVSYLYNDCEPMTIPKTVSDPERAGVILENICALTNLYVDEVYINDMAERKLLRDQDSLEMIRLVYDSPTYMDPGGIYGWVNINDTLNSALSTSPTNIVSKMAAIEDALQAAIAGDIATALGN